MKIDPRDIAFLDLLQRDAEMPLHVIAEKVNLSLSACSRRIAHLRQAGFVRKIAAVLDRRKLGIPTTVFIMIRSIHSEEFTEALRKTIAVIPEIVEVHRLAGNIDYIIKVNIPNAEYYDTVYKKLIAQLPLKESSAYFSMETLKEESLLPLSHIPGT